MSTVVEKILSKIEQGAIEVDEGDTYRLFYPIGLPPYTNVTEDRVIGFETR